MHRLLLWTAGIGLLLLFGGWGFFGHQQINRLAVFTLPADMIPFFKAHIHYLTENAVNPDKRRYILPEEAPRHYIDLDHYGDSALYKIPHHWSDATALLTEDTLQAYGIVPWHINAMYYRLVNAFLLKDPAAILKVSADLGHYIGDAHVPLHTTENYNGQLTGQHGIHGFWESRLPELFARDYDFFVGRAQYISNPQEAAWSAVAGSNLLLDSVLQIEKKLSEKFGEHKYSFEAKANQTVKVYSREISKAYHVALDGMVERRMRAAIKMVGDLWYSAWIDAGQPELRTLINYVPSEEEMKARREELRLFREKRIKTRDHEAGPD